MDTNNDWLPAGYSVPKQPSDYMKLEDGANKFRVMSSPVMGYEYWNRDGKPVRLHDMPEEMPADIRMRDVKQRDGTTKREADRVKHFWAFIVWNYAENRLQVLELTQATIQENMLAITSNPDWGNPTGYDINITKKGKNLDTEYTVQPSPHKPAPKEAINAMKTTKLDLNKLFEGAPVGEQDDPAIEALGSAVKSDEERVIE